MKQIFLLFILFIASFAIQGQNTADSTKSIDFPKTESIKINEPEFDGFIVYANDSIRNGIRLE